MKKDHVGLLRNTTLKLLYKFYQFFDLLFKTFTGFAGPKIDKKSGNLAFKSGKTGKEFFFKCNFKRFFFIYPKRINKSF